MSKLQNAKEYLQKAHDIRGESATFLVGFKKQVQEELEKVRENRDLSQEGQYRQSEAVKAKYGVELLQKSHTRKQEFLSNVQKAHKIADETVYASLKKPDATKLGRFESELRAFKTEILLTPSADSAARKLTEFVGRLDDAYLADLVREQFADIAGPIISAAGGESAKYKLQLSHTFQKLRSDFESPEVKEAREVLELATGMIENPSLYPGYISHDAVQGLVGKEYAQYLENTDAFFTKEENATYKPNYVDPEEQQNKRAESDDDARLRKQWVEAVQSLTKPYDDEITHHRQRVEELDRRLQEIKEQEAAE